MEHLNEYGTPKRASGLLLWPVVSSASQNRLARLGMVAPFPWDIDCAGPPPVLRSNAQSWPETNRARRRLLQKLPSSPKGSTSEL